MPNLQHVPSDLHHLVGSDTTEALIPKLFVFDCDYTLWQAWIDTHVVDGPYKYDSKRNICIDRRGFELKPFKDITKIWNIILYGFEAQISLASRTHTPDRACQALKLLRLAPLSTDGEYSTTPDLPSWWDVVQQPQIYPGDKLQHLRTISKKTGVGFEDIIFFDDESRNRNVAGLGVSFVLVDEDVGVTMDVFRTALEKFARRQKLRHEGSQPSDHKGLQMNQKLDDESLVTGQKPKR